MVTASHNPPAGQRLQGLPGRHSAAGGCRRADRAAGRRRDRGGDPGGRSTVAGPARATGPTGSLDDVVVKSYVEGAAAGLVDPDGSARPRRRLHAAARGRRGGLHRPRSTAAGFAARRRARAGRARPDLPDRDASPTRRSRGRWTSSSRLAKAARRRHRDRQRPGRRPLRGGHPDRAGSRGRLADAARRRGRRAAGRPPDAARAYAAATRPPSSPRRCSALCAARGLPYARDAHRLQVDRAGR